MPVVATEQLLNEARAAYHALVTGTSAREVVDQNGERVTYTAANRQNLYNYIAELEKALTPAPVSYAQYHPAGFVF